MKNKFRIIYEIIWLIVAGLCLASGIHQTIHEGIGKSFLFFIFTFVSIGMYFYRRNNRKNSSGDS
ncbi:MAG TPA: hypothetical protein VE912_19630 [Bacteroidales bacterium]|nr:hypothetical protein [Bacteroidales bacterium]